MASKAHWGYDASVLEGWREQLTIRPADILAYPTHVAQSGAGIAGFYMLKPDSTGWNLEHLWLEPDFMGQGIGTKLLRHALHIAFQGQTQRVVVAAEPNAAGFYARVGGVPCGATPAPIPGVPERVLPLFEFQTADMLATK
jgi:GNAT superfamily N-acetyltransferase